MSNSKTTINYLVISGDIAFSGTKGDYDIFYEMIAKHIVDAVGKGLKIICTPGNHDLNRSNFSDNWRNQGYQESLQKFEKRNTYLNEKYDDFVGQFNDYTEFYTECLKEYNVLQTDSTYKSTKGLYGLFVDDELKIKFLLINTAWYCINSEQINVLIKEDNLNKEELIKLNNRSQEFGGLIIGQDKLKNDIDKAVSENPDYKLITVMHHPPHWLRWEEQFSHRNEGISDIPLQKLLKNTDILLTGHEHLPNGQKPNKINESPGYHLMGGMFLEDNIIAEFGGERFSHNRFSIIEIEPDKVKEKRFLYHQDTHSASHWRQEDIRIEYELSNRFRLPNQEDKIFLAKNHEDFQNDVIRYFEFNKGIRLTMNCIVSKKTMRCFRFKEESVSTQQEWLIIVPLQNGFYTETISSGTFISELKEVINDIVINPNSRLFVCFYCLDMLFERDISKLYSQNTTVGILEQFDRIIHQADIQFDKFRHRFFSENNEGQIPFNKIQDISFVNEVVPYWLF